MIFKLITTINMLKGIFRFFDTDNDGIISKNELYNFVSAIYKMLGDKEVESLLDNTVDKRVNSVCFDIKNKKKNLHI